jgi:hypothetical protein
VIGLPDHPDDWTYETVLAAVWRAEYEPGTLEFKEVLSGKDDVKPSICRTICAMANTAGGTIVFGIKDRKRPVESATGRIVGIPLKSDLRKEFGDKLEAIRPPVGFEAASRAITIPDLPGQGAWVVRIPLSPARPHEYDGVFYRRGDGGQAQRMSAYEVRDQMVVTEERFRKLKLYRLELEDWRKRATKLAGYGEAVLDTWETFDIEYIKRLLVDVYALFPSDHLLDRLRDILTETSLTNIVLAGMREGYTSWPIRPTSPDVPRFPIHITACDGMRRLAQMIGDYEKDLEQAFGPLRAEG